MACVGVAVDELTKQTVAASGEVVSAAGDPHVASVHIRGLGSDGAGVGDLPDGRVVFVSRTAPGDEVSLRLTQQKARWARGRLVAILRASPSRVEAACPYYAECGGCTLQHISYEDQLSWKARFVEDALKRIGGLETTVPPVEPSPKARGYRSRLTFTLLRLPGQRVVAGFHHLTNTRRIVDVEDGCILPDPEISLAWRQLRAAWGEGARRLPAGRRLRLTLRIVDEGVILVVEGGKGPGRPDVLLKEVEGLVAVWSVDSKGIPRLLDGQAVVHQTRTGEVIGTSPTAFLQVNVQAADELLAGFERSLAWERGAESWMRIAGWACTGGASRGQAGWPWESSRIRVPPRLPEGMPLKDSHGSSRHGGGTSHRGPPGGRGDPQSTEDRGGGPSDRHTPQ